LGRLPDLRSGAHHSRFISSEMRPPRSTSAFRAEAAAEALADVAQHLWIDLQCVWIHRCHRTAAAA
jgi:hypothetical protein